METTLSIRLREGTKVSHRLAEQRASLDSMPLDNETIQKVVDEANLAFRLNQDVFASMENLAKPN